MDAQATYQSLVQDDLRSFATLSGDNPLTKNAFQIVGNPIWLQPLQGKAIPPEHTYQRLIADPKRLAEWNLGCQYTALRIEREWFLDLRQDIVLVERVYGVTPHMPSLPARRELLRVTIVMRYYRYEAGTSDQLYIVRSRPEEKFIRGEIIDSADPLRFVHQLTPLSY